MVPGINITKTPKRIFSWFREDEFCEFSLNGVLFKVWEPFGDSSRYWIGPDDKSWHPEIDIVRSSLSKM